MTTQFSRFAERIFDLEKGYVNDPQDKGGATNFGITLATLKAWRGDDSLTAEDVKALSKEEAFQIYEKEYFLDPGFDRIPDLRLQQFVTDMGVHHGQNTAVQILQRVINYYASPDVKVDGSFGGKTLTALLDAVGKVGVLTVLQKLVDERAIFMAEIVQKDPTQAKFIKGWLVRAFSFRP